MGNLPLKKQKQKPRGTSAIVNMRRIEVAKMLADGYSSAEIIEYVMNKYNVGEEASKKTLAECYKEFKARASEEMDMVYLRLNDYYMGLFRDAKNSLDYPLALKVLDSYKNFLMDKAPISISQNNITLALNNLGEDELVKIMNERTEKTING